MVAQSIHKEIGLGITRELSLRVSVAALVRLVFPDPKSGSLTLALERKATFWENEQYIRVKAVPFGGAVRINDLDALLEASGGFHFDNQRSRAAGDLRILIRPSAWTSVRDFCLEQFQRAGETAIETSPERELTDDFRDCMEVDLRPDQYVCTPLWTVLENDPPATGIPTARICRVFETRIVDPVLAQAIERNSRSVSDRDLRECVLHDLCHNGTGEANAALTLPLEELRRLYRSLSPAARNTATMFGEHELAGNVPALLNDIQVSKFHYI